MTTVNEQLNDYSGVQKLFLMIGLKIISYNLGECYPYVLEIKAYRHHNCQKEINNIDVRQDCTRISLPWKRLSERWDYMLIKYDCAW